MLVSNVGIVLQWIPSHKGIIGNNVADQVAKNACSYESLTTIPYEYKDSLNLVNESLSKVRQHYWDQVKTNLHLFKAVPNIKQYQWISLNNRANDVLLARLRNGCADLNEFLYNIKKRDDPFCNHCVGVNETVEHFVLHCKNYEHQRLNLYNRLNSLNINPIEVNLQLLLTGGLYVEGKRLKILRFFVHFVQQSKRFDV